MSNKMKCLLVIIVTLGSCHLPLDHNIKYEVVGTASSVDITIINAGGGSETIRNVQLPWSKACLFTDVYYAQITAKINGSGTITVRIYDDDSLVVPAVTKSGTNATVTVSADLPYS